MILSHLNVKISIYKTSIVFPFVNYQNEKSLCVICNNGLCEINVFVDQYGLIEITFFILDYSF